MDRDYKDLWWEIVPTAVQQVQKTKEILQQGKSVAFDSGFGTWTESFINAVINAYQSENYYAGFDTLDLSEIEDYWTITDAIADRLGIGYMTQRLISELLPELPSEGYIWILKNVNKKREEELEKLIKHVKENHAPLMFLFRKTGESKVKGFENLNISPTRLDLSYFAWTLLLGRFDNNLIEYGAELAVELSEQQPEECARICQSMMSCVQDPVAFCKEMDEAKVIPMVHRAQVRIIEPLIEYGRVFLIDKLGEKVSKLLPFTDDYDNEFSKPVEVELRNLVHFYNQSKLTMDPSTYHLMDMLYRARNKVSHLELLTFEEVQEIIKESDKWKS